MKHTKGSCNARVGGGTRHDAHAWAYGTHSCETLTVTAKNGMYLARA